MKFLTSLLILILNVLAWCIEWEVIVGYNTLRHEVLLVISFAAFLVLAVLQFSMESFGSGGASDEKREYDRLGVIVGIGASVLLALSILASLPIIRADTPPLLQLRFHWAALVAFLWIVFGVFSVTWGEGDSDERRAASLMYARKIKTAALTHSLGWAGTAAIMLINTIQK